LSFGALSEQLNFLPGYLSGHLLLSLLAILAGIVVCVPLGAAITRIKAVQGPVLGLAGVMQTIPGIALLALMVPILGMIGFVPALVALIIYSFLPILRNTVTGIIGVDPAVVEAGRGIGMTDRQLLFKIELPLALPVIVAGIRTASVWVVGTATLATPVGATSLGNYIFTGLQTQNLSAVVVGCISAAALAIIIDQLIHQMEMAASRRSIIRGIVSTVLLAALFVGGLTPSVLGNGKDKAEVISIGSKPFTEQYILAELIGKVLEDEGYRINNRSSMGSIILFEALSDGSIDCYVDYTGTVWTNVMNREDNPDRRKILEEMAQWLMEEHGIYQAGALGFENTYALAVRKETADSLNLQTIGDLAEYAPEMEVGSDYEFFSRPEWKALKSSYNLNFNVQRTFDPSLMYSAISEERVDVISAYSTDGRIIAHNLVVLEDPKQALPPYDAVMLLSEEVSKRTDIVDGLELLSNSIDNRLMQRANKMVDLDKVAIDSAAQFLYNQIK